LAVPNGGLSTVAFGDFPEGIREAPVAKSACERRAYEGREGRDGHATYVDRTVDGPGEEALESADDGLADEQMAGKHQQAPAITFYNPLASH
jgi:hypothetical protein